MRRLDIDRLVSWLYFLPSAPLPRRMWAGSRICLLRYLHVGRLIERMSRVKDVRVKEGRTSPLVVVNVCHEIRGDGELAIVEEHDVVYRDMPQPTPSPHTVDEGYHEPPDHGCQRYAGRR